MTHSNSTIDQKYQEAIQSLKKINDDLFYDELKNLISDREQNIAEMNQALYRSIEKMEKSMEGFPVQISGQLTEEVVQPQKASLEKFNDYLTDLEKRHSSWQQQFGEYAQKTENILSGLKELLREDQEFAASQTDRVLAEIKLLQDGVREVFIEEFGEQAAKMNIKYDAISERLNTILLEMDRLDDVRKSEAEHYQEQLQAYQQKQRDFQAIVEEKWKRNESAGKKSETSLKRWLIGLAIGQGVTLGVLILYLL
jgi:hypothetical protein